MAFTSKLVRQQFFFYEKLRRRFWKSDMGQDDVAEVESSSEEISDVEVCSHSHMGLIPSFVNPVSYCATKTIL